MGDAASCAISGQTTPNGHYDIERMLKILAAKRAAIGLCGSRMDARGIKPGMLAEGAPRSSMDELTSWTEAAGKVLVFRRRCRWRAEDGERHLFHRPAILGL